KYFRLEYSYSNLKYARLKKVTEYSGGSLPNHSPIVFDYSDSAASVNYNGITTDLTVINIEQRNAETVSLDLTGNGKMDFIVYPKNNKNKFWIFKDFQSGSTNSPSTVNGSFEDIFPVSWINSNNKMISQGLAVIQELSNNQVKFKVYSNGSANPIYQQYTKTWNAPTYTYQNSPTNTYQKKIEKKYVSGDFNGDGLTDVIAIGKPFSPRYCFTYECRETITKISSEKKDNTKLTVSENE